MQQQTMKCAEVHFACAPGYLDMYTLNYRWFGAVWTYNEHAQRVVSGYWFGDRKDDVISFAKHSGWATYVEIRDMRSIKEIYESIRNIQQELDWNKRTRLPLKSMLSEQWRTLKSGFYVIQSRNQYPLYLSCIEKKGWFVYLMHATVCENDRDRMVFMNKVNHEHNIQLKESQLIRGLHKRKA